MSPDPTLDGLLHRAEDVTRTAAAMVSWATTEALSPYSVTGAADCGRALRLAVRMLSRAGDELTRYRKRLPDGIRDWRPGDPGESFDDCL